jgi:flagellar hook-basal body complex protein FliE
MSVVIPAQGVADLAPVHASESAGGSKNGFVQVLEQVNDVMVRADNLASGYAQGKVGLTEAVLAGEKADVMLQTVMAMRNRALAAYQEIMSMQV